jgi:hypothetical protein
MTTPIKIVALDDEGVPPRITSAEGALLERYRRGSRLDSWSHSDKITLTLAFGKANSYPGFSGSAVAKGT